MGQQVTQSTSNPLIVVLTKDDSPVTGLTYTGVTCSYRKEGGVFTAKTLSVSNFAELGNGVYTITFTAAEFNTVGSFTVLVQGATIDQSVVVATVLAASSTVPGTTVALETCTLFGHVTDLQGNAVANVAVSARVLGCPSIEQSQAALTDDLVSTKTDVNGQFFLTLVRLADVEIFIPSTNYRRRVTVPNQDSANLFTEVA